MTTTEPAIIVETPEEHEQRVEFNRHAEETLRDPVNYARFRCPDWLALDNVISEDEIRQVAEVVNELVDFATQSVQLGERVRWALALDGRVDRDDGDGNVSEVFGHVTGIEQVSDLALLVAFLLHPDSALTVLGAFDAVERCRYKMPEVRERTAQLIADIEAGQETARRLREAKVSSECAVPGCHLAPHDDWIEHSNSEVSE